MENIALQRKVTALANEGIRLHNLHGWTFRFNTNKSRRGVCKYRTRRIEVSVHMLKLGVSETLKVVAHELAHAIVGASHGHNHVWRHKAIELGDDGHRCGESMDVAPTVIGTCPNPDCTFTVKRFRRNTRGMCPRCRHLPDSQRMIIWEQV